METFSHSTHISLPHSTSIISKIVVKHWECFWGAKPSILGLHTICHDECKCHAFEHDNCCPHRDISCGALVSMIGMLGQRKLSGRVQDTRGRD